MKKMLKMIEKLFKQGRGFNLQSHGTNPAGDEFYNFALYPLNKKKGSYYYYHNSSLDVMVDALEEFMVDGKIADKEMIEEEESMEDML